MNFNFQHLFPSIYIHIKRVILLTFLFVPVLLSAQDEVKIAQIKISVTEEGTQKYISAELNELVNDSVGKPIEEADLFFYVQRTFSLLPIGEYFNTTDENGKVKVEFPSDLPADTEGNVKVIVKLVDNDYYANTEVSETFHLGTPMHANLHNVKRTLWAAGANAPISLLLLVNILIASVWGVLIYIGFRIYKISKM